MFTARERERVCWRKARSLDLRSASQLLPSVINTSDRISLSFFLYPSSSTQVSPPLCYHSSLHSLRSQIEKQTCWGMWRLVLAASVCGTGNGGFKWVGEGAVGWSGRSHENAVVNCAAAFQRRCNDRELGRKMEPQLESKKLKTRKHKLVGRFQSTAKCKTPQKLHTLNIVMLR